jgi:hypothetical protein
MNFSDLDIGEKFTLTGMSSNRILKCIKTGHRTFRDSQGRAYKIGRKVNGETLTYHDKQNFHNPMAGESGKMVRIYDNIIAIEARKGNDSLWTGENFRHEFKTSKGKASVYGLRDGSILIKGKKRLWKNFKY